MAVVRLHHVIFAAFILVIAIAGWVKAAYNWDTIPYAGLVVSAFAETTEDARVETQKEILAFFPKERYRQLVDESEVSQRFFALDGTFRTHLRFRQARIAYLLPAMALYALGVNAGAATLIVSILGFIGMATIVYLLVGRFIGRWWQVALTLGILFTGQCINLPRLSSSDSVGASFMLLGVSSILFGRKTFGLLFFCVAILARTDLLIPAFFVVGYMTVFAPKDRRFSIQAGTLWILVLCVTLVGLNAVTDAPGYADSAQYRRFLLDLEPLENRDIFARQIARLQKSLPPLLLKDKLVSLFCLLALLAFYGARRTRTRAEALAGMGLACFAGMLVLLLIAPNFEARHYAFHFVVILTSLVGGVGTLALEVQSGSTEASPAT